MVGAFQNIYSQPPSWYQGGFHGGVFYPILFVNSLDNMTARAGSVMASAPRSSGGSGFGGGGSSGEGSAVAVAADFSLDFHEMRQQARREITRRCRSSQVATGGWKAR